MAFQFLRPHRHEPAHAQSGLAEELLRRSAGLGTQQEHLHLHRPEQGSWKTQWPSGSGLLARTKTFQLGGWVAREPDPCPSPFWDERSTHCAPGLTSRPARGDSWSSMAGATYVEQLDAEMKKCGFCVPIVKVQNIKNQWSQKLSAWSGKYDRIYSLGSAMPAREVLILTPMADSGPGMIRQDEKERASTWWRSSSTKWLSSQPISDNMLDAGSLIWRTRARTRRATRSAGNFSFKSVQRAKRSQGADTLVRLS